MIHVQFQLWDMSQCALNKYRQVFKEALSFPSDYDDYDDAQAFDKRLVMNKNEFDN